MEGCAACSRAVDELGGLNASLRSLQLPIAVVGAGAAAVGTGIAGSTNAEVGGTRGRCSAGALAKVAAVLLAIAPTLPRLGLGG